MLQFHQYIALSLFVQSYCVQFALAAVFIVLTLIIRMFHTQHVTTNKRIVSVNKERLPCDTVSLSRKNVKQNLIHWPC